MNSNTVKPGSDNAKAMLYFLVALIPLCLVWQGNWTSYGLEMDEGMILLYPQLILDGHVPHRDFETFYTPGNLWLLAATYKVFGNTIETARIVGLLYHVALVLGVYILAARIGSHLSAAMSALTAGLILSPLALTPFAWLLGVALIMYSLIVLLAALDSELAASRSRWLFLLSGMLAGFGVLVRQDVGLAMLLVLGCTLAWGGLHRALFVAVGIVAALVPLLIHLLVVGWQPVWENLISYPIFHTRAGRDFPLSAASSSERALVFASFLSAGQMLLAAFTTKFNKIESKVISQTVSRSLIIWALFFLAISHQMMQRVEHIHVAFVAFLPIAGLWPVFALLKKTKRTLLCSLVLATPGFVSLVLLAADGSLTYRYLAALQRPFHEDAAGFTAHVGKRSFHLRTEGQRMMAQATVDFLKAHASKDQRLIIGPGDLSRAMANDTFFYYLLYEILRPGTYFLEFNPGSANRPGSSLAEEVQQADWIILNGFYRFWREPNTSHFPGDNAAQNYFENNFTLVFRAYPYEIYIHKRH